MAIFIANENGDWWEYQQDGALWVLNTDDLNERQMAEIEEKWGPIDGSNLDYPDKLERAIWQYGHQIYFEGQDLTR